MNFHKGEHMNKWYRDQEREDYQHCRSPPRAPSHHHLPHSTLLSDPVHVRLILPTSGIYKMESQYIEF